MARVSLRIKKGRRKVGRGKVARVNVVILEAITLRRKAIRGKAIRLKVAARIRVRIRSEGAYGNPRIVRKKKIVPVTPSMRRFRIMMWNRVGIILGASTLLIEIITRIGKAITIGIAIVITIVVVLMPLCLRIPGMAVVLPILRHKPPPPTSLKTPNYGNAIGIGSRISCGSRTISPESGPPREPF
jgi:hypothetical protein